IGWLMTTTSTAHLDEDKLIQNWGFDYDEAGNLLTRSRADEASPNPSIETFTYDSLNRVLSSRVQIPLQGYNRPESFAYDDLGNIIQKGGRIYGYNAGCMAGAGTPAARPAGPHAVCTLTGDTPFAYNLNGNLVNGGGRSIEYNAMNKSTRIQASG